MKNRWAILLIAALLAFVSRGCAQPPVQPRSAATAEPTLSPTPAPTPTPQPLLCVFDPEGDPGFSSAVHDIADSAAVRYAHLNDADALERYDASARTAVIARVSDPGFDPAPLRQAAERGVMVYVYAAAGQPLDTDFPGLRYDADGAAGAALDEALAYPPHDTPVRLLGMFESGASGAHAVWAEAIGTGKVFDKGTYLESDAGKDASVWLADALDGYFPGMLDGIYCGTAQLALLAADVLAAENRDDLEIFSAGANAALLARMQRFPFPVVRAAGADPSEAGRICAEQALILLYGGSAQTLAIRPRVFSSGA